MPETTQDEGNPVASGSPASRISSRRLLWFVSSLGVIALVFGAVQLQRSLNDPFSYIAQYTSTAEQPQDETLTALKTKDTDADELTDYDELYLYNTSPYIADSDSDGIADAKEIREGTNPNCPEGKTCGIIATNSNSATNAASNVNASTNTSTTTTSSASAQQLRAALLAAGVPQSQLDTIDDATLLSTYQTVAAEEAVNSNVSTTTNAATNASADLENLSAAEIRTLLEANGVSSSTLDAYDDATLRAIYLQALKEADSTSTTNTNGS